MVKAVVCFVFITSIIHMTTFVTQRINILCINIKITTTLHQVTCTVCEGLGFTHMLSGGLDP
jgi:hypothetical protein